MFEAPQKIVIDREPEKMPDQVQKKALPWDFSFIVLGLLLLLTLGAAALLLHELLGLYGTIA